MAVLRFGSAPDLAALVQLWHDMLVECDLTGTGLVSDWRERLYDQFQADMQAGSGTWFVAENDGAIVATCTAFRQIGRSNVLLDVTVMLAGMYVLPAYRGRGIARELAQWALAWCRECGCKTVRLHASQMGRPLYESLGFRPAPEMMRLDLR